MTSLAEKQPTRWPCARAPAALGRFWERNDGLLYALFAVSCTAYLAGTFYGYLLLQTGGSWSAPLDDVFIHFDYARAFARGYPFQWSEGNGFSSGNTSLSYPVVLGIGYWVGLRDARLMLWAAIVAGASVLGLLWWARHLAEPRHGGMGTWAKYLLPPALLSMGALNWTLWSGMENALHLGLWGLYMRAVLWATEATALESAQRRVWLSGAVGALLVATRPESSVCVAVAGGYLWWRSAQAHASASRPFGWRGAWRTLCAAGLPAVGLLGLQALANRALTGETSANGAIAKLFLNNPYLSPGEMLERYGSLLRYIVPRLVEHHFADVRPWGYLVPALALVPLACRRTRPVALLLWAQIVSWMLLIALNNQVRWHNERYAMPAVAWLLVLAAIGLGLVGVGADRARLTASKRWALPASVGRGALALALGALYWHHQEPRMRDQIWFFGRASRNIRDQHVAAGTFLRDARVHRVLVGDAGAITYTSDRAGLDIIGLGGYQDLPMARATVHGLGAAIELLEHIPAADRPDVMAVYPSWWGDLPTYFGRFVTSFPVHGNVICGGAEKVIYEASWSALDGGGRPRLLGPDEWVSDELDVADLPSEHGHRYQLLDRPIGFVTYRLLDDPAQRSADLFDAGRIVPMGATERSRLVAPGGKARLVVRTATSKPTRLAIRVDGRELGELALGAGGTAWHEPSLPLPADLAGPFELSVRPMDGDWVSYHCWVVAEGLPRKGK